MAKNGASELIFNPVATSRWRGAVTEHFDGKRFHNEVTTRHASLRELPRLMLAGWNPWRRLEEPCGPPPPERVQGLRVTFVGHATCLVQVAGLNLLTDPVWGERASALSWLGPRRYRPPGLRFEDLPPIDAVLLSHNHYDHLCAPTMRRLALQQPTVFAPLGNAALLRRLGIDRPVELDWWQSARLGDAEITLVPAKHFSGRGLTDRDASLWGGFVVQTAQHEVFFAGDTAMGPHFERIRERLGAPDLALLPIGAYLPSWFMSRVHIGPAEAVQAARMLGARVSVPIHYGTFRLSQEGMDEPLDDLAQALRDGGPEFWVLGHGEGREVTVRAPRADAAAADTPRDESPAPSAS